VLLRMKSSQAHASPRKVDAAPLGDLRFCHLLSKEDWSALPEAIRRRFSKRVTGGNTLLYAGEVVETRLSLVGRVFANLARVIGGPLPLFADTPVPAIVSVTEDAASGGQIWTRLYARRNGLPQVIHSCKQFAGATGLEEQVGCGVGMALSVHQEHGALVFRSARYFFRVGPLDLTLPGWMTPGALSVTHAEESGGCFSFLLEIVHPIFGLALRQLAIFREVK